MARPRAPRGAPTEPAAPRRLHAAKLGRVARARDAPSGSCAIESGLPARSRRRRRRFALAVESATSCGQRGVRRRVRHGSQCPTGSFKPRRAVCASRGTGWCAARGGGPRRGKWGRQQGAGVAGGGRTAGEPPPPPEPPFAPATSAAKPSTLCERPRREASATQAPRAASTATDRLPVRRRHARRGDAPVHASPRRASQRRCTTGSVPWRRRPARAGRTTGVSS